MTTFNSFPIFFANHKKSNKHQSYGFYYLSQQAERQFNHLINQYDDCAVLSINTPLLSKEAMQLKVQAADELIQATGNLGKFKQVVKSSGQQITAVKSFDWYKTWNQALLRDDYWEQLKSAMDALFKEPPLDQAQLQARQILIRQKKLHIEALKRSWKRHGKFSHYSSTALLYAADKLSVIERFLDEAQEEFNQRSHKLPNEACIQYSDFLKGSLKQVQREKNALAAAMSARLQVIRETRNITNDDLTIHLISRLKKANALNPDTPIEHKRLPVPFDSQVFRSMHHYVADQGGTTQLHHAFNLQQSDKTILLTGKQCATQYVFLPAHLSKYVPEKPSKFASLFKGHQFRYEFFQDKTALLLKLSFLNDLKITTNCCHSPIEDAVWQQIKATEKMLDTAIRETEKQKTKGWNTPFYKEKNQLLAEWQILLQEQKQKTLQYELTYFEKWASLSPVEHVLHKPYFSADKKQEISNILVQLECAIAIDSRQTDDQPRLKIIKEKITDLFAKDIYYAQSPEITANTLNSLSKGIAVDNEQLRQTLDYCNELAGDELHAFKQKYDYQIKTIPPLLERYFSTPLHQLVLATDYTSSLAYVRQCGQLLRHLKSPTIQKKLDAFIAMAITHCKNWLATKVEPLDKQFTDNAKQYQDLLEELATIEQIEQLVAIQLKQRQLAYEITAIDEPSLISTKTIEPASPASTLNEQEKSRTFLAQQQQIFKQQCEQHQEIMQKQQALEQQMATAATQIDETLQSCENTQQACSQLAFNNTALLAAISATQHGKPAAYAEIANNSVADTAHTNATTQTATHTVTSEPDSKRCQLQ